MDLFFNMPPVFERLIKVAEGLLNKQQKRGTGLKKVSKDEWIPSDNIVLEENQKTIPDLSAEIAELPSQNYISSEMAL